MTADIHADHDVDFSGTDAVSLIGCRAFPSGNGMLIRFFNYGQRHHFSLIHRATDLTLAPGTLAAFQQGCLGRTVRATTQVIHRSCDISTIV